MAILAAIITSCGPKDATISKAVQEITQQYADGISANVQKGVVTLSGELPAGIDFAALEAKLREIKGVKNVINNLTVKVEEPVITPDQLLTEKINQLINDTKYSDVKVSVMDGIITLEGSVNKTDLMGLIQTLSEMQPKKINNNLVLK